MALTNTRQSFGSVARALHWLTALLITLAIVLGLIASQLGYGDAEALQRKAALFSLHKTIGLLTFAVALIRILWALVQPHPANLHPERRAELFMADLVHWLLYALLVLMPLSGWIHHAATTGFAPIWWPFGQDLPFVPKSEAVASVSGALHWLFSWLLIAVITAHVAGALKHHVLDRDATLLRMLRGVTAGPRPSSHHSTAPAAAVAAALLLGLGSYALTSWPAEEAAATQAPSAPALTKAGNWSVVEGQLEIGVQQMGSALKGQFAHWQAQINFDEEATALGTPSGAVKVEIDLTSLSLGSVTTQASGPDFLNAAVNQAAVFEAEIIPTAPEEFEARGQLTLNGQSRPLTLPFTLSVTGNEAKMQGQVTLDRRDFGIGAKYGDEKTVGFGVVIDVNLSAKRN